MYNDKYEEIKSEYIDEVQSKVTQLRHKKTNARILLFENEDENKVFSIGFRTPPKDDTGLPHILEHSTLCGSKKFPAKEPFVELLKGSLNTFLNAMTYPDKTVYPIASCNDKDFANLMEVYMDAVFYPNVHEKEEIFMQEGWHYELNDENDPITINGVVYNEMKGAFSSPEQVVMRESMHALFPDTSYGVESGGNPDFIPNLSYADFKAFHKKYYHPSNCYIELYGNMDMNERLEWLDKEYLSKFDPIVVDSKIKMQEPFNKTNIVEKYYPVGKNESLENKTYLAYNAVIGTSFDSELAMAFQIITYCLLDEPGAPLKQALLDAHTGTDILSTYDSGILQPMFSIIAKEASYEKKDDFVKIINETLTSIVKNGIDRKSLKSALNYFEFRYRESDFGGSPKGLVFSLNALDSWLYDDTKPFDRLKTNVLFDKLRKAIETTYFEDLIKKYLIDNTHKAVLICNPSNTLTEENDNLLKEKLAKFKNSLSKEEINDLILKTKHLKEYQGTPSTKEELESIPLLSRKDITNNVKPLSNIVHEVNGVKIIQHDEFTNGIGYLSLYFDTRNVNEELIPYISLLANILGYVDTKNYTYQDLSKEILIKTGGIQTGVKCYSLKENDIYPVFSFDIKALFDNMAFAMEMVTEIIKESRLDDKKRLHEILDETKSRLQMAIMQAGHRVSMTRALSYYKASAKYNDLESGIAFYQVIDDICKNFDERINDVIKKLEDLMPIIFRKENLLVSYTASDSGYIGTDSLIKIFTNCLYTNKVKKDPFVFKKEILNEGFMTPGTVQFVTKCGKYSDSLKYTGALRVLKVTLSYDYLWTNVRVKGGAYGCFCNFTLNGDVIFTSYRDPNLENTLKIYDDSLKFIDSLELSEDDIVKLIIGAIGEADTPLTPNQAGQKSLDYYILNITEDDLKKERDEILNVTLNDLKELKEYIKDALSDNCICVVGNETKVEAQKQLFHSVKNIF